MPQALQDEALAVVESTRRVIFPLPGTPQADVLAGFVAKAKAEGK